MKIISIIPADGWWADCGTGSLEPLIAWALLDHDESEYEGGLIIELPVRGIVPNMQGGTTFADRCEGFVNYVHLPRP
ncbi:MAG: hypothetical protein C0401_12495 [Anaerolinea sp.]|nr:hypothetical protein [Anaerolinea sp.]